MTRHLDEHAANVARLAGEEPEAEGLPQPLCLLGLEPPPPVPWLADGFLLANEYQVLGGEGGSFKTTAALAIACALAGGYPVFGAFPVGQAVPVIVVSEEDSLEVINGHILAIIDGMGYESARVLANLHVLALEGVSLHETQWTLHLQECAERLAAELVVFDPLADLLTESESDPNSARPVVQFFRRLTRQGAAVLLVAHLGKPKEGYGRVHRLRGAGSWANAARALYLLEQRDGGLWLTCEKLSRAKRSDAFELALEIEAHPANPGTWTSAKLEARGVVGAGSWQIIDRRSLTPSERKALAALERHRDEPVSWSRWVDVSGVGKSVLSEAKKRLQDLGLVRAEQVGMHAGRPRFCYTITGSGVAALVPEPPSTPRLRSNSGSTPANSPASNSATPPPPYRGASPAESEWGDGVVSDSGEPNGEEMRAEMGPGTEQHDESSWAGLLAQEGQQ